MLGQATTGRDNSIDKQHETGKECCTPRLRSGCYMLRYTPVATWPQYHTLQYEGNDFASHCDGTLRVHRRPEDGTITASGDLYYHKPPSDADLEDPNQLWDWPLFEPDPRRIPIFTIDSYRYYVRVVSVSEVAGKDSGVRLRFELHELIHSEEALEQRFENRGCYFTTLNWSRAPRNYPSPADFLTGEVRDAAESVVGFMTIGWVSDFLRRAVVEIDRVPESEAPFNNGDQENWQSVFREAGWDVTVEESDAIIPEPSGESWSDAELHEAMLLWRSRGEVFGREWRFHLLAVRRLDSTERGIMYDRRALDSNNIPREGAAISSHWVIPDEELWGTVRGMRFGIAAPAYFRTAVHEIGHAFCLIHNGSGFHFMRPTEGIAAQAASVGLEFPNNIEWSFSPDDTHWLRHAPDPFVRPGGIAFGELLNFFYEFQDSGLVRQEDNLVVEVTALNESVPFGAPARLHIRLVNHGARPILVPATLGFKGGCVSGRVVDAAGVVRTFRSLIQCVDAETLLDLPSGGALEHSFTLLRGPQGALFPTPGDYRVEFDVTWHHGSTSKIVSGACQLTVSKPRTAAQTAAARKILETPDALLTLVLAGDHLPEGRSAIEAGLANPILRPHYAAIEARRLARRFKERRADLAAAAKNLDDSTVLTPSEIQRLAQLAQSASGAESQVELMQKVNRFADNATLGRSVMRFLDNR